MTNIEDLVRQALTETPVPPAASDPLARLERRVRRARRRLALASGVAAAGVAAAVIVPLTTTGHSGASKLDLAKTPPPTSAPSPSPSQELLQSTAVWLDGPARAVTAADDGTVWALTDAADPGDLEHARLVQFDATTGTVLNRVTVPGPVTFLSAGQGHVWAYGGGDGGYGSL